MLNHHSEADLHKHRRDNALARNDWRAWVVALLIVLMLGLASREARADVHQLSLTHHEFEPWNFVPQPGDQIDIINRSDIAHSIYVTAPDGSVTNLGVQLPGEIVSWQPREAGEFILQCWIHPIIRAHMNIEDAAPVATTPFVHDR